MAAQLGNGRYAVLVSNQLLDLNLPQDTQTGDKLDMTVMAKDPRLTFALNSQTTGQPTQTTTTAANPRASGEAQLSGASRYLNDLLTSGDPAAKSAKATGLTQSEPLFNGTPDTSKLAEKLGQALGQSGLFYESHQAEWATGQRTLQSLQQEPQATLSKTSEANANSAKAEVNSQTLKLAADSSSLTQASATPASNTTHAVDPQSLLRNLVQQQLDVIDQRPIIWQGQAWPGQPMQWQLQAENEREGGGIRETEAQRWNTTLSLDLPNLAKSRLMLRYRKGNSACNSTPPIKKPRLHSNKRNRSCSSSFTMPDYCWAIPALMTR